MMERKYDDKKWLYEQYVVQSKTVEQMAKECEVSTTSIYKYLSRFNITVEFLQKIECPYCSKEFKNLTTHLKYCKKNIKNIQKGKRGRRIQIISVKELKDYARKNKIKRFGGCNNKKELLELIISELNNRDNQTGLIKFQKIYEELYENESIKE